MDSDASVEPPSLHKVTLHARQQTSMNEQDMILLTVDIWRKYAGMDALVLENVRRDSDCINDGRLFRDMLRQLGRKANRRHVAGSADEKFYGIWRIL